mmetsp:Transcript_11630/g.25488  ORF Transcript_11630/g.25488 Transcript_11630/m.25488 type:complete len:113 (-) Transcript_11630:950-1288(-)
MGLSVDGELVIDNELGFTVAGRKEGFFIAAELVGFGVDGRTEGLSVGSIAAEVGVEVFPMVGGSSENNPSSHESDVELGAGSFPDDVGRDDAMIVDCVGGTVVVTGTLECCA